MKILYSLIITLLSLSPIFCQVGINVSNPSATLEVGGNVKTESDLFLENPGDNSNIRGSKFLINSTTDELLRYDINISKYGPINYVELAFKYLSTNGLQFYDTKISTTDYLVSVQGFSYREAGNDNGIMPHSLVADENIEGFQVYAYKNSATGTWCLKAFINNSQFQVYRNGSYENTELDLWLNLIIYRDGFISKSLDPVAVDMGNSETITVALPTGF